VPGQRAGTSTPKSAKPSPLSPALPERKRDVLSLKVAGCSHENIGAGFGMTQRTVSASYCEHAR
jgi:DNA-binding NarL/FixJ family response regulator